MGWLRFRQQLVQEEELKRIRRSVERQEDAHEERCNARAERRARKRKLFEVYSGINVTILVPGTDQTKTITLPTDGDTRDFMVSLKVKGKSGEESDLNVELSLGLEGAIRR